MSQVLQQQIKFTQLSLNEKVLRIVEGLNISISIKTKKKIEFKLFFQRVNIG